MINEKEYEILKELEDEWKWIARDKSNSLNIYTERPFDTGSIWSLTKGRFSHMDEQDGFKFIRWSDEEPWNIEGLIEAYETLEEINAGSIATEWAEALSKTNQMLHKFATDIPENIPKKEIQVEPSDPVNQPNHYFGEHGLEMREVQENFAPRYAKYGGLAVSDMKDILKYLGRAPLKNGVEDLHKAKKHLEWLIESVEQEDD